MADAASKVERSRSFGTVASDYERFRPGPPTVAVDWMLPDHVGRVADSVPGPAR
jgi:hypothetical protein